ncbi:16S rRNA (cytosine(967)-C(5))-methyltransferase RsmB [Porticoccus sp.]
MNVRVAAAHIIASILQGEGSLSSLLPVYLGKVEERDRGLLQQLCYGTLRFYPRLSCYLGLLLAKPFKAKDLDIEAVLACSLYQLLETRVPPHAAVNEAVAAAIALKKNWAKGLVNAVLRRFLREQAALTEKLKGNATFNSAHPAWLMQLLDDAWHEQLEQVLEANNQQAPMVLRVNRRHGSRDDYRARLEAAGIAAHATPFSDDGLLLQQPCDVSALPGFGEGDVSVQDEAAQLAAPLLDVVPGQRILDACCAPGGKTGHLLELLDDKGEVVALDLAPQRLQRVEENLERLGLQAELIAADAQDPASWWDGRPFDRILLDAPCSASGVIRRHPDVKLLRTPADIAKLAALQRALLQALWPLLADGGMLLYATCSVLPDENDRVISAFVRATPGVTVEAVPTDAGMATSMGRQLLPQLQGHDGFYFALLKKMAAA